MDKNIIWINESQLIYLDIQRRKNNTENFLELKNYDCAIKQANFILEKISILESLIGRFIDKKFAEDSIMSELKKYKLFANETKEIAGSKMSHSPERLENRAESIESIAFWEDLYKHTSVLY